MNELLRKMLALPEQASTMAFEIDVLHYVVILTALLGAFGVTSAVAIMLLRFHRRPGYTPPRRPRRVPVRVEVMMIGGLLGMFLVFWVIGFRQFVKLQNPPRDAIDVYVVGKQWMWTFAYPNGAASIGDLYVPANRPIRLILTSRDVIHSFYVPAFRVKQDVVPGRTTFVWFDVKQPGTYNVFCTEYCGTEHSRMRGRVIALDEGAWTRWLEDAEQHSGALANIGERVAAQRGCLRCHTVDGTPHIGPTWAGAYGTLVALADGTTVRADEAYLTESMMDPERRMHRGFPPVMPSYRGLLDAGEVAALVEYIRSLAPARQAGSPLPVAPLPAEPITSKP
jgi:cytochrome c oxidase subunit 2